MKHIIFFVLLIFYSCSKNEDESKQWEKIISLRENKNYDSTIILSEKILKNKNTQYRAPAIYMIADVSFNFLKDYKKAIYYFNLFTIENPENNLTPISIYISGFIYRYNLNNKDSALYKYKLFEKKYPNHEYIEIVKSEIISLENEKRN